MNIFDFAIIGSGPCGMISANLLSDQGKTIVIEQGPNIEDRERYIYTFPQISSGYAGAGINVAFGLPPVLLSEGRCIGGGSTVNSSLHHKTPSHIWKKWREIYGLKGFDEETVSNGYKEIENIFNTKKGIIKPSIFYETAKLIGEKVERIPRWGEEDKYGKLDRWTAKKIFYKKLLKKGVVIKYLTKFLNAKRDKDKYWSIYLKDLTNGKKCIVRAKNLILALGAGKTPVALRSLGLKHRFLGKFEIHPSARLSIFFPDSTKSNSIVEPFQITGHFPHLMIGSSATRNELSESFYPFKKNIHGIDFSYVQNFYAMAPSNKKGKIFLKGPFKGFKIYFLDDLAKYSLKNGIEIIIKIAKKANSPFIYNSGMVLDLRINNSKKLLNKFISTTINQTLSSVHIMSSAAIGENNRICPLNSRGRVNGIDNLLVIDQSTMPTCPTVNPQATSCLISLINTKYFLNDQR